MLVGHGLQLSLIPLRAELLGWSTGWVGALGSIYFAGFVAGCFTVPALVTRVGHVRVFATLSAVATAALLGIGLGSAVSLWLPMRFATGWSISGLYLVIESWLNEQAADDERGSVLSIYTVIVLAAMTLGQFLLNLAPADGPAIIVGACLFLVLASVPVNLSRVEAPATVPTARFSPLRVWRTSRAAAVGSLVGGISAGAFYAMGPVYGRHLGLGIPAISLLMAAGILGGAAFQWPLGWLSDRIDRRWVILLTMISGVGVCIAGTLADGRWVPAVTFLFGGTVMPIYAVCLALANDSAGSSFLEVGTGILITNAFGAIVGPVLASQAMVLVGAPGFFFFAAVCQACGAAATILFLVLRPAARPHAAPFEIATTAAAQGAVELDPRS